MTGITRNEPPRISLRTNIWIVIPIGALIVEFLSASLLLLNYVHVFTAILWTGTDIFMAFLLGPVLRNVGLSTRKEIISWLMPKDGFLYANCCSCYNYSRLFPCFESRFNYFTASGCLLGCYSFDNSFCHIHNVPGYTTTDKSSHILWNEKESEPDMSRIQKLMKKYVKVVAIQTVMQFAIIFIMAEFSTGFFLNL